MKKQFSRTTSVKLCLKFEICPCKRRSWMVLPPGWETHLTPLSVLQLFGAEYCVTLETQDIIQE